LKKLAGKMEGCPDTTRRHGELAGIGLGIGNELRNGCDWDRWIHLHYKGATDHARNRRNVADEIKIEPLVERCINRRRRADLGEGGGGGGGGGRGGGKCGGGHGAGSR